MYCLSLPDCVFLADEAWSALAKTWPRYSPQRSVDFAVASLVSLLIQEGCLQELFQLVKQVETLSANARAVPELTAKVAEVFSFLFPTVQYRFLLPNKATDLFFFFPKQLGALNSHLLQMYGEKAEEAQELQLDLADVKSLYQAQIQQLLLRLDGATDSQ